MGGGEGGSYMREGRGGPTWPDGGRGPSWPDEGRGEGACMRAGGGAYRPDVFPKLVFAPPFSVPQSRSLPLIDSSLAAPY